MLILVPIPIPIYIVKLPISNFPGLTSTPIILVAPAFLQPITVANPTAPRPHTAHELPGLTFAATVAAPYPVGIQQPITHTLFNGALSSI